MNHVTQGLKCYLALVENGREFPDNEAAPRPPDLLGAVVQLLAHGYEQGELATESAWQLDAGVCRALEKCHLLTPPGGWARLASLACGCGVLRPNRLAFEPGMDMASAVALDEAALRRKLCEAFTQKLVPPASAAGLFIMLGVHPAWALWVSHSAHHRAMRGDSDGSQPSGEAAALGVEPGWRDASIFEPQVAQCVEEAVFMTIAILIDALRRLDSARRYPIDAFARLTHAACQFARQTAERRLKKTMTLGLVPFLDTGDAQVDQRSLAFAAVDLFDAVFIPAGVARRFEDGSFCIFEGAFDEVRVGPLSPEDQATKLTWMLADQADFRVA